MSLLNDIIIYDQPFQAPITWVLGVAAGLELCFVLFITVKDIFKEKKENYILKDQHTIYFVTLVVIGLTFKMLVVDSLLKDELRD